MVGLINYPRIYDPTRVQLDIPTLSFRVLYPEQAHHLGLGAISLAGRCALTRGLMAASPGLTLDPLRRPTRTVGGVEVPLMLGHRELPSRLGLAAGMDKDAEAVLGMSALGYAFVEIGTVTPRRSRATKRRAYGASWRSAACATAWASTTRAPMRPPTSCASCAPPTRAAPPSWARTSAR